MMVAERSDDYLTYECKGAPDGDEGIFRADQDPTKFRFTIPSDWKITYGPDPKAHPPSYFLRIYDGDDKLRAVFPGITSFREITIPIMRRKDEAWVDIDTGM